MRLGTNFVGKQLTPLTKVRSCLLTHKKQQQHLCQSYSQPDRQRAKRTCWAKKVAVWYRIHLLTLFLFVLIVRSSDFCENLTLHFVCFIIFFRLFVIGGKKNPKINVYHKRRSVVLNAKCLNSC